MPTSWPVGRCCASPPARRRAGHGPPARRAGHGISVPLPTAARRRHSRRALGGAAGRSLDGDVAATGRGRPVTVTRSGDADLVDLAVDDPPAAVGALPKPAGANSGREWATLRQAGWRRLRSERAAACPSGRSGAPLSQPEAGEPGVPLATTITGTGARDSDLGALDVAWDLEPLARRRGPSEESRSTTAEACADRIERPRGTDRRRSTPPGSPPRWHDFGRAAGAPRPGRQLRRPRGSRSTRPTRPAARSCSGSRSGHRDRTRLLFFDLEWAALDRRAGRRAARRRAAWRSAATTCARRAATAPHLLTEPEEKVLTEKAVTGRARGRGCSSEQTSAIDGRPARRRDGRRSSSGLSLLVHRPTATVRQAAAEAVTAGLAARAAHPGLRVQHAARRQGDRRPPAHYPTRGSRAGTWPTRPATSRSQALVDAVVGPLRHPAALVRAQGADARPRPPRRLRPHGVGRRRRGRSRLVARPRELVLDAYASFSPELADVARTFFDERWIDAPLRPGKRPGAFCAYTVPSHHPYVLLNWTAGAATC